VIFLSVDKNREKWLGEKVMGGRKDIMKNKRSPDCLLTDLIGLTNRMGNFEEVVIGGVEAGSVRDEMSKPF